MKLASRAHRIISALLTASFILTAAGNIPAQNVTANGQAPLRGQKAIARLGSRLPEVAQRYGKTAEELKGILESDSDLWINGSDDLFYADTVLKPDATSSFSSDTLLAQAAPFALSDTFLLHSKPGSNRTIYLDFNGHTTSGATWNSYTNFADIVSPPFTLDSDPSFSDAELEAIQIAWQRMAEDYAPFDVNVTTQYPGEDALTRSISTDPTYGMRVVFTKNNFYPALVGGISYVGMFNYIGPPAYQPVFVMADYLCANTLTVAQCGKYLADSGTHEVGHTLGLSHDGLKDSSGTLISNYYGGSGDDVTGWAPIMGAPFGRPISHWSKGEYVGANNLEDDIAVMQTFGLSLRADDHGNTTRGATNIASNSFNASGFISTATDVDYFTFTVGSGPATINISPASEGPNLNIRAQLLNSSKVVLETSDGPGILFAGFSRTLTAGTYFLTVEGVGESDLNNTNYPDYGSLGQYKIAGSVVPTAGQAPVAAATSNVNTGTAPLTVNFYGSSSYDTDGTIAKYLWSFGDGTTSTSVNPTKTFSIAGRYPVTLTVTDSQGLVSTANLTIDALVNQLPVAQISASTVTGLAPLRVNFSSAGSYDPEGGGLTYLWQIDNVATSTTANTTFTFAEPRAYRVTLTVKDSLGLASAPVYVDLNVTSYLYLQSMSITKTTTTKGTTAKVLITVYSADGKPRPSANVSGTWSGAVSANQTATTNTKGQVTFTSPLSSSTGPFMFTVNDIIYLYTYPYDPSKNAQGVGSVSIQ